MAKAPKPTKDKPDVMVNLDAKPNAVPGAYTIVLRGVSQVPYATISGARMRSM